MEKRMKHFLIPALFIAASLPAAHAEIYTCIDKSGNKIYTQDARSANCQKADVGRLDVYSSLPAKPVNYTPPAAPQESSQENADYQAAQKKLADAQKALEEGKKVRYGNERNYARYLQRIAGLEAEVKKAQNDLNQAGGNAGATPSHQ